jgi:hypothetical protein
MTPAPELRLLAWSAKKWTAYEAALRKLVITMDGVERQVVSWPDWAVTTVITPPGTAITISLGCERR